MSISASLSNALSGLQISGQKAEIVSQNVANSQTEGYGRRELATSISWGRVTSDGVIRHMDRGLLSDRRQAESQLGADQRTATMLEMLEGIIGIPGDEDSISGRLAEFESALILAANDPSSDQRLLSANTSLNDVTAGFRRASVAIQALRQDADQMIDQDVSLLNSSLKQVEQLNVDILRTSAAGQDTSNLMDARQQIVDGISGIVPLREFDRGSDRLGLMTTTGLILLDSKAAEFTFTRTPTITADMTLDSGGLSGIEMNGQPLDADNGFGRLSGGALHSAFQQRDKDLVNAQGQLDGLAYDLATRFADTNTDPTFTMLGLLTDVGVPIDLSNLVGMSARLTVNENVDPTQSGDISRWRDGVDAVGAGPIGNGTQLERWREALNSDRSVADQLAEFSSETSGQRLKAQTVQSFSAARWDSLHSAELAFGVDTDVELQNLLVIEQAYAANARVIQAVNSMINKVLEI